MKKSPVAFYTVGHSNHTMEAFATILKTHDIGLIIDVRKIPKSRKFPQFAIENLPGLLEGYGIDYVHMDALGGRRTKSKTVPPEVNGFWQNQSFHNYADYAMSPEFEEGLKAAMAMGAKKRAAFMCSEVLWWRCHRRIITDYLLHWKQSVFHIIDEHDPKPAVLTKGAVPKNKKILTYPAEAGQE